MIHYKKTDIEKLPHIYKINLINSCSGYKSANLIGTKSSENNNNVAVFSSVTHLGSAPALLGFFLRPTTVPRDTYANIKETGVYTINHIYKDIIEDAHHTSAKYDASISEFDITALQPEEKNKFHAPFVKGSPVQIGMKFVEEYHIKANDTLLIVGEIIDLYINDNLQEIDGFINLSKGEVAAINALDGYAVADKNKRFSYQRPKH
ncbi:flavin oxidoreductase [Tamlana sedimentorum]|uniref:Flavin oxidoreductase n=1 Tax=Neotamlana sedimentorum TaxID=1435349 RepID=A0A0D7WEF9_9FLAO|nr:flavin reductase family protein [Tamlana sedimentorum]KJD36127.1 flavin oxidoreductase [Tamlana sedimentorum]